MEPYSHKSSRRSSEHELNHYNTIYRSNQPLNRPEPSPSASSLLSGSQSRYEPLITPGDRHELGNSYSVQVMTVLIFFSHLLLTLIPIAFIVLAFVAVSVDGDAESQRGKIVLQAQKFGPTLFPIVFAAVVGRLMKTLALWRAERGSTIGLLEQLNGSQNLFAAVERWFFLSRLRGWGLLIILLWALSPLGGQSSLRVLEVAQRKTTFGRELRYLNTDDYNSTMFQGASSAAYELAGVQAIYQASLLAPSSISASTSDLWGNVKIPLMQAQSDHSGSSTQDWLDIERNNNTVFSSLSGIIISGLQSAAAANFTIESSYFNLTCPASVIFSEDKWSDFQDWLGDIYFHVNTSRNAFDTIMGDSQWNSFTIDTNFNFSQRYPSGEKPMNLIYASRNGATSEITAYNCSVGLSHVESMITCNGTVCGVDRMRPSRKFTDSSVSTPWNQNDSEPVVESFVRIFPWMTGTIHPGAVAPADLYVAGNNTPFQPETSLGVDYSNVSGLQVAQRLGTLINTAWQGGLALTAISSPPPDPSVLQIPATLTQPFAARSVDADIYTIQVVYHAKRVWVGLTVTISVVLLACGIAGMVFRYTTVAPDIIGYVSTMTRDNPYFHDPRTLGADTLTGLERAKLLQNVVVQISDVSTSEGKSHVALRSIAMKDDLKAGRLSRGGRNTPLRG